jgi:hypothetical protein
MKYKYQGVISVKRSSFLQDVHKSVTETGNARMTEGTITPPLSLKADHSAFPFL